MFSWLFSRQSTNDFSSKLFDEKDFYHAFIRDLSKAREEVVIESPFINARRVNYLLPHLLKLTKRRINVVVITRAQYFYTRYEMAEIESLICKLEQGGVKVILTINGDHRKLAIIDRKVLWEGSLNILSHTTSREIMRRIGSKKYAREMIKFTRLSEFL